MGLTERIGRYIAHYGLLSPDGVCLAGVSGGADSVCLLLVLLRLGYRVEAVHCNFMLRGAESDRDEQFVVSLCQRLKVPLHITHFDTRTYATLHKVSIEMAARELRYRYFEQLRQDIGADCICVAHHRDDSVETVLLNLMRGTGIEGLTGIKPRNGRVVRPLLCVSRTEIEQWLQEQGQDYVTDSTNLMADVLRNKLRLEVIPLMEQALPGATGNIWRTAQWVTQASSIYKASIEQSLRNLIKNNALSIEELMRQPSPESILHEWLKPVGFNSATVTDIFEHIMEQGTTVRTGAQWHSASHQVVAHQGQLLLAPLPSQLPTLRIPEAGTYIYGHEEQKLKVIVSDEVTVSHQSHTASLDADKVGFPLTLRPVQAGDRFRPFGMKHGTKLVSDFMADAKLSPIERQQQLVVTDADGQIVWVVGRRPDQRYCVAPTTRRTLIITLLSKNDMRQNNCPDSLIPVTP